MPFTISLSCEGPSGQKDVTEFVAVGKPFKLGAAIENLRGTWHWKLPCAAMLGRVLGGHRRSRQNITPSPFTATSEERVQADR